MIRIVGEWDKGERKEWTGYCVSIEIPEQGELNVEAPQYTSSLSRGKPRITEFHEVPPYVSCPHSFPAVQIGDDHDFYMLWVKERKEWVGILFRYPSSHLESLWAGVEEDPPYASGPYKLNLNHTRLISEAYKNSNILPEEILHTPPSRLLV